ncbi:VOC family protein [Streptomyces pseudogriseolus]|uniref:VOC family protein n=1 Tax=Streptomyces pseudogriseolus TaxID=36817 RepID=UPI003FA1B08D
MSETVFDVPEELPMLEGPGRRSPAGSFERGRAGQTGLMTDDTSRIRLVQTVLDSTDARTLAEFYRSLLGLEYAEGDEPPPPGAPDEHGRDWLVLRDPGGGRQLAFQQVERLREPDWPDGPVPHPGVRRCRGDRLRSRSAGHRGRQRDRGPPHRPGLTSGRPVPAPPPAA